MSEQVSPSVMLARQALCRLMEQRDVYVDDETPADDDPVFQLVMLAYPDGPTHTQIGALLRGRTGAPHTSASPRAVRQRKSDNPHRPLSRQRSQQIEVQALATVKLRDAEAHEWLLARRARLDAMARTEDLAPGTADWPTREDAARAKDPWTRIYRPRRESWAHRLPVRRAGT